MLEEIEVCNQSGDQRAVARKKAAAVLRRLQALRGEVCELSLRLEENRKQHLEELRRGLVCSECGNSMNHGQEVVVKDTNGIIRGRYHQECFGKFLHLFSLKALVKTRYMGDRFILERARMGQK